MVGGSWFIPVLSLTDNSPILPGQTRVIEVTARDRQDRLPPGVPSYDLDSSPAGLLFFYSVSGVLYQVEVGGFTSSLSTSSWLFKR